MNGRERIGLLLMLIIAFSIASTRIGVSYVRCDYVEFKVSRVVWGDNIDNPIKAYPGDTGVPLTVEVQNLSPDKTIKGVSAILMLDDSPFTDVYGNRNASATGKPTVGEILNPTDEIKPKGFFTLTFTLDIDENAIPGTYTQTMTVRYSVESGNDFIEGTPQTLSIDIVVSKMESTITVSVSPQVIEEGEAVRVSGAIDPAPENATVTLTYIGPERRFNSKVEVNVDGSFAESFKPDARGTWSVNASWSGDIKYKGNWASASFEVRPPVSLSIFTSSNRLVGGRDNRFTIKIVNNGEVPLSALEASLTVPNPLVIHGKNSWKIEYLDAGNSTTIDLTIYAPDTSIGSTYSGSLTINYRDDYGESHTDTFPIGLVIIGKVELILYGKTINPELAKNGSKVEFTATLLNKGTVSAMYVNVSILPNPILRLTSESSTYIGEVEENSQSPFTLGAYVREDVKNGTYPVTLKITYRDDQHADHGFNATIYLRVVSVKVKRSRSQENIGFFSQFEEAFILTTILAASAVILLLYRKHLARRGRSIQPGETPQ